FLLDSGCDHIQGFFVARPLPAAQMSAFAADRLPRCRPPLPADRPCPGRGLRPFMISGKGACTARRLVSPPFSTEKPGRLAVGPAPGFGRALRLRLFLFLFPEGSAAELLHLLKDFLARDDAAAFRPILVERDHFLDLVRMLGSEIVGL